MSQLIGTDTGREPLGIDERCHGLPEGVGGDPIQLELGTHAPPLHVFADGNPGYTTTQLTGAPLNYKAGSGTTEAAMASLNHLNPAAFVYTGVCNDYSAGGAGANPVPSATTAVNLVTSLEGLASACATRPSIIINIEHQRQNLAMTEPWQNYVDVAYKVATDNGYAVFDGG